MQHPDMSTASIVMLCNAWGAGVATYVAKAFSPVAAQTDCLGSGEEDIDREGRCTSSCDPASHGQTLSMHACEYGLQCFGSSDGQEMLPQQHVACRCVLTDLGAFVLINVYAPNAGDRRSDGVRVEFKVRFLEALKRKADILRDSGREVLLLHPPALLTLPLTNECKIAYRICICNRGLHSRRIC